MTERAHVHPDGETLLELVLSRTPPPVDVTTCPACAAELRDLSAVVQHTRQVLDADALVSAADAARVAERVLARTTREDLGLDGDLALVTSFVRSRLAASRGLRLLAASLLVHLLALPVLAWFGFAHRRTSEPPTFRFETPDARPELAEEPPAELPALDAPGPLDAAALDAAEDAHDAGSRTGGTDAGAVARADSLRIARFFAARGGPELPPERPDEDEVERLLRLRAQELDAYARRTQASAADASPGATPAVAGASGPVARALLAELLLDRVALGGGTEGLVAALAALDPAAGDAAAGLAAAALARAEAYGVLRDDRRLRLARAELGEELGELVLAAPDGVRRVDPLDRRWTALLGRASSRAGAESAPAPVVAAWLAAGR